MTFDELQTAKILFENSTPGTWYMVQSKGTALIEELFDIAHSEFGTIAHKVKRQDAEFIVMLKNTFDSFYSGKRTLYALNDYFETRAVMGPEFRDRVLEILSHGLNE